MDKLKIGGKERYVDFSMYALALYCREDGKELDEMVNGLNLDLLGLIKLVYVALKEGAAEHGGNLPDGFNERMVGKWFSENPEVAGEAIKIYAKQQGVSTEEEPKKGKKPKA